jgi:hypothetical protein
MVVSLTRLVYWQPCRKARLVEATIRASLDQRESLNETSIDSCGQIPARHRTYCIELHKLTLARPTSSGRSTGRPYGG